MRRGPTHDFSAGSAPPASTASRVLDSLLVASTNLVPLYGVWRHGWNSFLLILLFVVEAVIVLATDAVKTRLRPPPRAQNILSFEFAFILFFGTFAILMFGRDENSSDLLETTVSAFNAARALPLWSVTGIALMRAVRTVHELREAGALGGHGAAKVQLHGGGWMLLLFFLVMTGPFIADRSPNPTAGLAALVLLKSSGELLEIWGDRIAGRIDRRAGSGRIG